MSQFHLLPSQPCRHTMNKGYLSPPYSLVPIPPFSVPVPHPIYYSFSVPRLSHNFDYHPYASRQGNIIALISCKSPSVNINTSIPEDRPRGPYILVSLTSLMSSLYHLRGFLSASQDSCFSHAQLQPHHRTVEIRTGYWSMHYLIEYPSCDLTLSRW